MDQPITDVGRAQALAKPILDFAAAVEGALRLVKSAKEAQVRIDTSEAACQRAVTARTDAERELASLGQVIEAERVAQFAELSADVERERVRAQDFVAASRAAMREAERQQEIVFTALEQARQQLIDTRAEIERSKDDANAAADRQRLEVEADLAARGTALSDLERRLAQKREEYRKVLEQVQAVLHG